MPHIVPPGTTRAALVALGVLLLGWSLAFHGSAFAQDEAQASTLSGQFSVRIVPGDVPTGLQDGAALIGQWSLTFDEDGEFSLARQDVGPIVTGAYDAGPATITFTAWDGIVGCQIPAQGGAEATYAWRQAENQLTLTAIDDACAERLALLTTHALGSIDACEVAAPAISDPFAPPGTPTPTASAAPASGVAAQEGFGQGSDVEAAIDDLLRRAGGCWATADPDRFMMLHSQGLRGQIAMMGSPEAFSQELREFMETPLGFRRIGEVNVVDPTHAWVYVEINLGGVPTPQQVNFVLEDGVWRFDSFALFGPPIAGEAPGNLS